MAKNRSARIKWGYALAACGLCAAGVGVVSGDEPNEEQSVASRPEVHVKPNGDDPKGVSTGAPLHRAMDKLGESGGVVLVHPGEYVLRKALKPASDTTIRGVEGGNAVLKLPPPTLLRREAIKGEKEVAVNNITPFLVNTTVELVPPQGNETFTSTKTKSIEVEIASIEGNTLRLKEPLPVTVPNKSRIGYPNHLIAIGKEPVENVVVENLAFDGGWTPDLPMPGHAKRCAIWAASPYTYADGPQAPPHRNLTVRHCIIRNCYGRGVAFYNVVESAVIGCRMRHIHDEAIDFDHFNAHCRAVGNDIEDVVTGVTLNDASHCKVRYNRIIDSKGGAIRIWWWHKVDPEGVNEHNVVEHNTVLNPSARAIFVSRRCKRNVIRYNFIGGPIKVVEEENRVYDNTAVEGSPD